LPAERPFCIGNRVNTPSEASPPFGYPEQKTLGGSEGPPKVFWKWQGQLQGACGYESRSPPLKDRIAVRFSQRLSSISGGTASPPPTAQGHNHGSWAQIGAPHRLCSSQAHQSTNDAMPSRRTVTINGADASTTLVDSNVAGFAHTWTASGNAGPPERVRRRVIFCDGTGYCLQQQRGIPSQNSTS
jgi:hypothetical protein